MTTPPGGLSSAPAVTGKGADGAGGHGASGSRPPAFRFPSPICSRSLRRRTTTAATFIITAGRAYPMPYRRRRRAAAMPPRPPPPPQAEGFRGGRRSGHAVASTGPVPRRGIPGPGPVAGTGFEPAPSSVKVRRPSLSRPGRSAYEKRTRVSTLRTWRPTTGRTRLENKRAAVPDAEGGRSASITRSHRRPSTGSRGGGFALFRHAHHDAGKGRTRQRVFSRSPQLVTGMPTSVRLAWPGRPEDTARHGGR